MRGLVAVLGGCLAGCVSAPVVVQDADAYNSWPMVQTMGSRLVCAYSRGSAHSIDEGGRGVFVRHSDGGGRLLAVARSEKNSGPLFQLVSSDNGRTWKKLRTNVADVAESTPSLVRDDVTGDLTLYYYHRGAKKLKRRVACADKVFAEPTAWSDPEILFIGSEERPYDAGNVNVTVLNGTHYAGLYTGSPKKTAVLVLGLPPVTKASLLSTARD